MEVHEKHRALIVGLDPGATVGYAVIDCAGNCVVVGSSKMLDLDLVVARIAPLGRVLFVGTDKAKVPDFVERFATKLGAHVIHPRQDLLREEKKTFVDTASVFLKNDHEVDAFACALFAQKQVQPLLLRIERFCKETQQEQIREKVLELVVKKKVSIHAAAAVLQEKQRVQEPPRVSWRSERESIVEVKRRFESLRDAYEQVLEENQALKNSAQMAEKRLFAYQCRKKEGKPRDKLLEEKERRIVSLSGELRKKHDQVVFYQQKVDELYQLLARVQDLVILKRVKNLGLQEVKCRMQQLYIREGDVVLVDDADQCSEQGVSMLKSKVGIIVAKKCAMRNVLPFVVIPATKLSVQENRSFGFVAKQDFEREKNAVTVLQKIIEEYQEERRIFEFASSQKSVEYIK